MVLPEVGVQWAAYGKAHGGAEHAVLLLRSGQWRCLLALRDMREIQGDPEEAASTGPAVELGSADRELPAARRVASRRLSEPDLRQAALLRPAYGR
eukprot:7171137-Lingulodinium_polyedra.AAC.1